MLFRVLGPVEIDGAEALRYIRACKPRTLLATLLLRANSWVSLDDLVDAIWAGQQPPASADRNVGTYIWQLRKVLPPPSAGGQRIESRSAAYRIRVEPGELDTDQFESLLAAGVDALDAGDPATAVQRLQTAADLWRGVPFEGLATDQPQIARLVELRWTARERLADAFLAAGRRPEAIMLCTGLTAEDPLRESAWARLLVAFRESGRTADALAAYRRARAAIVEELGTEPGPELRRLHQDLLTGDRPETIPPAPIRPAETAKPSVLQPLVQAPDDFLRTALDAADVLVGRQRSALFAEPAAALGWLDGHHAGLTAAIRYFVTNERVADAWLLCSAAHEYVEAGGRLDNWPQLLVRVATATQAGNDRYGELVVRNILGIAYTREGRAPEACVEFTTALGLAAVTGDRDAEGAVLVNLAIAEADFGAPGDAATHLGRALHLLQDPAAATTARELLSQLNVPAEHNTTNQTISA